MEKKVVLITGTSSGFGNVTAKTLALKGYIVYASMRNIKGKNSEAASGLENWAGKENVLLRAVELDVTDDNSVKNALTQIIKEENQIDIVINNAGVAAMGFAETYTNEQLRQLFDVNVIGSNRVIREVIPYMRMQKEGLIIQISSLAASLPMPFHGNYPATKLAIEIIIETYRHELKPFGIDLVIIQPGGFPTSLINNAMKPAEMSRINDYGEYASTPEKIFAGAAQALSGPNAPSIQAVADAINKIIDTSFGQRPLRTIVDEMGFVTVTSAAESINSHTEKVKMEVMKAMGFTG